MKRTHIAVSVVLIFVGALLVTPLGRTAQAQGPCAKFRAVVHLSLPTPNRFEMTDTWGGLVYASLDGEVLLGAMSGNDGQISSQGVSRIARGGLYKICFNYPECADSFTFEVQSAVFPFPPGMNGFGEYLGHAIQIVEGTGRFQFASGNLNFAAPFVVWRQPGVGVQGRASGEITGDVCGIQ
jgi:hypothetical protein